ncbi:hypothetical protein NEHOM01_0487 [Nematocida homosporus]|uniref:uncharacterized protein n=1 Tax=Nematocida homosporus TaxID=1912981 RepID=UPI00221EFBDE|nr:uncharacterized protein NEHOM01_0487 [Nematocida homosporus]KAI5184936.1 hypothetical protein NEHOM01_0487 [Nematocida homosporus]
MSSIDQQEFTEFVRHYFKSNIESPSTELRELLTDIYLLTKTTETKPTIASSFDISGILVPLISAIAGLALVIGIITVLVATYRKSSKNKLIVEEETDYPFGKYKWSSGYDYQDLDDQSSTSGWPIQDDAGESLAAFQGEDRTITPVERTTTRPNQPSTLKQTLTAEEQKRAKEISVGLNGKSYDDLIATYTFDLHRLLPLVNGGLEPQIAEPQTLDQQPLRTQVEFLIAQINWSSRAIEDQVIELDGYLSGLESGNMHQQVQKVRQMILAKHSRLVSLKQQYQQLLSKLKRVPINKPNEKQKMTSSQNQ